MSSPNKNQIGLISKIIIGLGALLLHIDTYGQSPLLPVVQSTAELPMLGEAIRDPKVLRNLIRDDLQASAIKSEIAESISDLSRAKGVRARDLTYNLLASYANLVAYYEDVLSGALPREGNSATVADLRHARQQMVKFATAYAKIGVSKGQIAHARYHLHTQNYILNNGRSGAIAELKRLQQLDGYLKRRAELVVALHELDHGNAASQARARSQLANLIRPLHLEGAVVARLALARKYAGLNSRGRKYQPSDKRYRSYLYQATSRAKQLSPAHQRAVLSYAVGIWRAAEGQRSGWENPPLNFAGLSDLKEVHGIKERQAISHWRNGNYHRAALMYDQLSAVYANQAQQTQLDMRILDIRASENARLKRSRNYEIALQKMLSKYQDDQSQANIIKARYQRLVDQEISVARQKNTNSSKRNEVIALVSRYKDHIDDSKLQQKYDEINGDLFALNKDHTKAVGIYLDLLMNSDATNKAELYRKAIASQRILANWPAQAPWSGIRNDRQMERTQLLAIHKDQIKLYESNKAPEWHILAHIGLLEVSLGDTSSAFMRWEKTMASSPSNHSDARQAAGFMLQAYNRANNWAGQERLVRLCLKTGLQPLRANRPFDLSALLAEALLYGGKELLESGKPKAARIKLAEFVKKFRNDRRHDEGQFYLAHAYRGEGDHKNSITTLIELTRTHSNSQYLPQALILGGDWAMDMALEEEPIYFHQLYVDRYPSGKETPRIRDGLIMIYEGRELIGQATDLLEAQASDSRLNHDQRLNAAIKMLDLEERFGGSDKAFHASQLILRLARQETSVIARALAFQVRYFKDKQDVQKMQQLESRISQLGGGPESEDALAEARYYIAQYIARAQREEIQSVALRDPTATLNEEYAYYLRLKSLFDRVCSNSESSYCAPAMLDLSAKAGEMKIRIEDITIAEDLDKRTVDAFLKRKNEILVTLQRHHDSYLSKANQVVQHGNTNPTHTEQVLWENSHDWNFDRITGEVGNGYIQFSPNLVVGE